MSNDLTFFERQKLQYWLRTQQSLRSIARIMRKDHSVVSREIRRNSSRGRKGYRADLAQKQADQRRHAQRRGKIERVPALKDYVVTRLQEDWSPEEIAGILNAETGQNTNGVTISHETIYQYIYTKAEKWERLYRFLPQRRVKRRKRGGRKVKKALIPERISIHDRPEIVNTRNRIGDWESDTLEFKRTATAQGVSVQCERRSGLIRLHRLNRKKSPEDTLHALLTTAESLDPGLWRTCTFDNGVENTQHTILRERTRVETYFCDPYKSWQKGSVENVNKLLRRYLPRHTDLDALSDHDLEVIQERLNNRPRKRLGYKTPNQVLREYLGSGALLT